MTPRINYAGTLFYYDGIQAFEGRDQIGGHYVGVLIGEGDDGSPLYAVVGTHPEQLQKLKLGRIELGGMMKAASKDGWFVAALPGGTDSVVAVAQLGEIPPQYLPDDGLFLSTESDTAQDVQRESSARNSLALELSLDGTRSTAEHRLPADMLGGLLIHIQSLVKNAYRKALSKAGATAKIIDAALLEVAVPAQPGSFKIVLVPAQLPDLFQASEVSKALDVVDYLLGDAENPQNTLDRVRSYTGHTASAFLRLLRFAVDTNLVIHYSWASPDRDSVTSRQITKNQAVPLLALLSTTENLAVEPIEITGRLRKVDADSRAWRITDDRGQEFSGKTREGVSLEKLVIGSFYIFECEEEVEEVTGTGREIRTVYLVHHKPAKN